MQTLPLILKGRDGFLSVSHIGNKLVVTSVEVEGFWRWKREVKRMVSVYELVRHCGDKMVEGFSDLGNGTKKAYVSLTHFALHDALIESGITLVGITHE